MFKNTAKSLKLFSVFTKIFGNSFLTISKFSKNFQFFIIYYCFLYCKFQNLYQNFLDISNSFQYSNIFQIFFKIQNTLEISIFLYDPFHTLKFSINIS